MDIELASIERDIKWIQRKEYISLTSNGNRSGGRAADGEHELLGTTILEEAGEHTRPVRSNNVVGSSQKGVDVVGSDLGITIVQGDGGKTGHELVLQIMNVKIRQTFSTEQNVSEIIHTLLAP